MAKLIFGVGTWTMPEFFRFMVRFLHGRRRKAGMLTLLVALVFLAGWLKSLGSFNHVEFQSGPDVKDGFASTGGALWWGRTHRGDYDEFQEELFDHLDAVERHYKFRWHRLGFKGYELKDDGDGRRTTMTIIPYWSITIPLTLISVWLLLTKPRKSTQRKILEPATAEEA